MPRTHFPPPAPVSEHRNSNNHVSQNNCRCWGPKVCWARNYLFDRVEQSLRQSGLPYVESYSLQAVSFSVHFRQVKCYKVFLMAVLNELPLLQDALQDRGVLLWMCLRSIKIMLISDIEPYMLWDVTVLVHEICASGSFNEGSLLVQWSVYHRNVQCCNYAFKKKKTALVLCVNLVLW